MFNEAYIGTIPETVAKWVKDSQTAQTITYRREYTSPDLRVAICDYVVIKTDIAYIRVTMDYKLNDKTQPDTVVNAFVPSPKGPVVEIFHIGTNVPVLTLTSSIVGDAVIDFTTIQTAQTTAAALFTNGGMISAASIPSSTVSTADFSGAAIEATGYRWVGVQFVATNLNTADGVVKIQDSINGTEFNDITGASITVASGTTSNMIRYTSFTGKYVRVLWSKGTNTAGTMKADVLLKA